jgi:hypothetical protein
MFLSLVLVSVSCDEEIEEAPKYSEEHILLIGDWEEQIELDSLLNWSFTLEDLSWGNYTHPYIYVDPKILVSGMQFEVVYQAEDTLMLWIPNQDTIRLVRVENKKASTNR